MYEPIAEDKGIALRIHSPNELSVHGDRDLLIEAVANLVDNAVGGQVEIGLVRGNGENIVRVKDTGPGISNHERDAVLRRFYRSDSMRHTSGLGLGLNLVAAIAKLHGFRFTIVPGPGCVVEIACPYATTLRQQRQPAEINPLGIRILQSKVNAVAPQRACHKRRFAHADFPDARWMPAASRRA
jgi:signal transduction histidine kinase